MHLSSHGLRQVAEPLVNLDVANRVKTKINRCVFTAQEVISQMDDAGRAAWQQELLIRQSDLEMFYDALLYGSTNLPGRWGRLQHTGCVWRLVSELLCASDFSLAFRSGEWLTSLRL